MRYATRIFLFAFLIMTASAASAADFVVPDQKIVVNESPVPLGENVVLGLTPIVTKPPHYVSSAYTWIIVTPDGRDKTPIEAKDGSFFFSSGLTPMTLKVTCVVTHLYIVDDGGKVTAAAVRTVKLKSDVIIGGPGPGPVPPPNPGPVPVPVLPDGRYKLAQWAYDTATTKVTSAGRSQQAAALAASFRGIASAANAGTIKDVADMLAKTTASNVAALAASGGTRADWLAFFQSLQGHVYDDLYTNKQINTVADFAAAWAELATGLSQVP